MGDRTVIFEHLPKTAGISLQTIALRQYSRVYSINSLDPLGSLRELEQMEEGSRNGFRAVIGHGASHSRFWFQNPWTFTMLREPVRRFLSQYNFIRRMESHRSHQRVTQLTLDAYIEKAPELAEDNLQVRFLSKAFFPTLNQDKTQVNQANLDQALNTLKGFDGVYDMAEFDAAVWQLRKRLGWRHHLFYRKKNISKTGVELRQLTPDQLSRIRKSEALDLELYQEAKANLMQTEDSPGRKVYSTINAGLGLLFSPR